MKIAMKICAMLLVMVVLLCVLNSCDLHNKLYEFWDKTHLYEDEFIIGRNSKEIQEKYGAFDRAEITINEDGLYCDGWCWYLTAEGYDEIGIFMFIAPVYNEYYAIHFDENGIADITEQRAHHKGG